MNQWITVIAPFMSFAATLGCGIHSYYMHTIENEKMVSSKKWIYGIYAAVFLVFAMMHLIKIITAISFWGNPGSSFQIEYITMMGIISYLLVLVGVKHTK